MAKDETNATSRDKRAGPARRRLPIALFLFGPSLLLLAALAVWYATHSMPEGQRPPAVTAPASAGAP